MRKVVLLVLSLVITLALASSSYAITIWGNNGGNSLGEFTGTLVYNAINSTSATLQITLTNTTPVGGGGAITGFAFNNPGDLITDGSMIANYAGFSATGGDNSINGQPYGYFDIGILTGANFQGGNPLAGILYGDTGVFNFTLTGINLDTLDEYSFVNEKSEDGNEFFLVRIQSIDAGAGSDKVPGETGETPVVPEPATMLLLGSSLLGLGFYRKKIV